MKQSPSSALELDKDDKENETKKDWMLATAVLDRISAIVFTIVLVGGTLVFFVLFAIHPWSHFHVLLPYDRSLFIDIYVKKLISLNIVLEAESHV